MREALSYIADNFAHSQGESANPSLWRQQGGLWVPSLGVTGGVLRDLSGNGNHGTLKSDAAPAVLPTWVATRDGPAVRLTNASLQYIEMPLGVGDIPASGQAALVLAGESLAASPDFVLASKGTSLVDGWWLQQAVGALLIFVTNTAGINRETRSSWPTGRWVCVVNIAIPSVRIWINGVDATTTAGTHLQPVAATATPLRVGRYSTTGASFYASLDVRAAQWVNRSLSAAEIRLLSADFLAALRRRDE